MQKYRVSLTPDAENDIAELMAFYSELVDDESAERFLDEAMATIAKLEMMPSQRSSQKSWCSYVGSVRR